MKRSLIIHVSLLLLLLVLGYFTWTREPSGDQQDIPMLSVSEGLARVVYETPDRKVAVERRKDGQGPYHTLTVETWETPPPPPPEEPKPAEPKPGEAKPDEVKPGEPKPDEPKPGEPKPGEPAKPNEEGKPGETGKPSTPGDTASTKATDETPKTDEAPKPAEPKAALSKPEPAKVRKVQVFKGSKGADELMKSLSQLKALRVLGKVEAARLKEFGLAESKKSLRLEGGGATRTLILGDNTYGSMDTYVLDKGDGQVYVLRPSYLQDFAYAEFRLMDRELVGFQRSDVERVTLKAKGRSKVLLQRERSQPDKVYWADPANPDKKNEQYANWMDMVYRLNPLSFVGPDEKITDLKEILSLTYEGTGKTLDTLTIYETSGPPSATPAPGSAPQQASREVLARSGHTRDLVRLSLPMVDEVSKDLDSLLK